MTDAELQIMLDKAAKRGAREALKDIGLLDDGSSPYVRGGGGVRVFPPKLSVWSNIPR